MIHKFKKDLYDFYLKNKQGDDATLSFDDFFDMIKKYKKRKDKYLVYVGYSKKDAECKKIIYVGTTIQYPLSRWFYHKTHKKDLVFKEFQRFDNPQDMLDKEFELIQKFHPSLNKITDRKQNFNTPLSLKEIEERKGNPEYCQCCLKRRVSKGYKYCYFCS